MPPDVQYSPGYLCVCAMIYNGNDFIRNRFLLSIVDKVVCSFIIDVVDDFYRLFKIEPFIDMCGIKNKTNFFFLLPENSDSSSIWTRETYWRQGLIIHGLFFFSSLLSTGMAECMCVQLVFFWISMCLQTRMTQVMKNNKVCSKKFHNQLKKKQRNKRKNRRTMTTNKVVYRVTLITLHKYRNRIGYIVL